MSPINAGVSTRQRLVALRLIDINTVLVKEEANNSPVVFRLHLGGSEERALSDQQLRMLSVATPWDPINIEAEVGAWDDGRCAAEAAITAIEAPPPPAAPSHYRRAPGLRWGLAKRKRGDP